MQVSLNTQSFSNTLADQYQAVRKQTFDLCQDLETEDFAIQSMVDVSPPKWHLAHTTWFFENFLLSQFVKDYVFFHPQFNFLFNSYYESVGKFHIRQNRGILSRPTIEEIFSYRFEIDRRVLSLIEDASLQKRITMDPILIMGIQHEQQHQELLLTDVKYNFFCNPLKPAYQDTKLEDPGNNCSLDWQVVRGGIHSIGFEGEGFAYDNERPRHKTYLEDFAIASRLVTNREYLNFIQDCGYERPELWLSDGWKDLKNSSRKAPLYWEKGDEDWLQFTLVGLVPLCLDEPVCHINFYEATAYARWVGHRLPTEFEWEVASQTRALENGHFMESGRFHPQRASAENDQLFGDVWEWTQSAYAPYPGYHAPFSAIGEYNGKFMSNQQVLRGGSCLTSKTHIRSSYRNFFYPSSCWQCTGIRLVKQNHQEQVTSLLSTKNIFLQDVLEGLQKIPKSLSPKYFYNKRGSELFDAICQQPEYYLTRIEENLFQQAVIDLKKILPDPSCIIEFGSGNCEKIGYLLNQLPQIQTIIPIDISKEFIQKTAQKLAENFPHLHIHPLAADFLKLKSLPQHKDLRGKYPIVFFPGSTIGNFETDVCSEILKNIATLVYPSGGLLIGIDLIKDKAVLEMAYNDKKGVTAAFNLNVIQRINEELKGNVSLAVFKHYAFFNHEKSRIEMHLVCLEDYVVSIGNTLIPFKKGETIHTENSYKFELEDFIEKASKIGFTLRRSWVDPKEYFGLLYFTL